MGLEYAVFAVPAGSEASIVNAVGAGAATTSERVIDLACTGLDESETVKVRLEVPLAVGVPERIPVFVAKLRPRSAPLTDQVYGAVPPVALSAAL
jgi:hypothetical protein